MDRATIPSLDDLLAFEATARLGSVRMAADSLALTHGAISRRITRLSENLGFKVFQRQGRGLRLTAAGEALFLTVGRFFNELDTTIGGLRAAEADDNTLVLSCEPSVAMSWLIPRLGNFQSANPDITLHLSVGGGPPDFRKDRVDLALRRFDFAMPASWCVQRLFVERVGPVMAPGLAAGFDAGDYIGLGSRTRPNAWTQWLARSTRRPRPKEVRYHDHHFLMVEAAVAGLGVALSPLVLSRDHIAAGRLIAPVGFRSDGTSYGLIWPGERGQSLSPRAARLSTWITDECVRSAL